MRHPLLSQRRSKAAFAATKVVGRRLQAATPSSIRATEIAGAPKTAADAQDHATASIALRPLWWKSQWMRHPLLSQRRSKAAFAATKVVGRRLSAATPSSIRATEIAGAPKTAAGAQDHATASIAPLGGHLPLLPRHRPAAWSAASQAVGWRLKAATPCSIHMTPTAMVTAPSLRMSAMGAMASIALCPERACLVPLTPCEFEQFICAVELNLSTTSNSTIGI